MKLFIDTTNNREIIVGLDSQRWEEKTEKPRTQILLQLIDRALKERKVSLKKIKEIEINPGPGSFTGLRVGMAVANTLGWVLEIPVNGQRKAVLPKYE